MKRDRKIHTQGTGKAENKVENIRPGTEANTGADKRADTGVSSQLPGEAINEGNQVTADIPVGEANQSKPDTFNNHNTSNNYAQEVEVNTGGVALEQSPGATNQGNNPSNPDFVSDREAIARSVVADAEKQTGSPTGAIYGSAGEIIAVKNIPASKRGSASKKKAAPESSPSVTLIYGRLYTSGENYFLEKGNVPEDKIQVVAQKDNREIADRMAGYNGQFVSVAGEPAKKNKADKFARLIIYKIISHEDIALKAYALSQENPSSVEENWLKAEQELLQ